MRPDNRQKKEKREQATRTHPLTFPYSSKTGTTWRFLIGQYVLGCLLCRTITTITKVTDNVPIAAIYNITIFHVGYINQAIIFNHR